MSEAKFGAFLCPEPCSLFPCNPGSLFWAEFLVTQAGIPRTRPLCRDGQPNCFDHRATTTTTTSLTPTFCSSLKFPCIHLEAFFWEKFSTFWEKWLLFAAAGACPSHHKVPISSPRNLYHWGKYSFSFAPRQINHVA